MEFINVKMDWFEIVTNQGCLSKCMNIVGSTWDAKQSLHLKTKSFPESTIISAACRPCKQVKKIERGLVCS